MIVPFCISSRKNLFLPQLFEMIINARTNRNELSASIKPTVLIREMLRFFCQQLKLTIRIISIL